MREVPEKLSEVFDRLLNDFSYFEYALLNGGWVAVLAIPIFSFLLWWGFVEIRQRK